MKRRKYIIKSLKGCIIPEVIKVMTIRGNHPTNWKTPTSTRCNSCECKIEIGEAYFHFWPDDTLDISGNYCLGCVDFEDLI